MLTMCGEKQLADPEIIGLQKVILKRKRIIVIAAEHLVRGQV